MALCFLDFYMFDTKSFCPGEIKLCYAHLSLIHDSCASTITLS